MPFEVRTRIEGFTSFHVFFLNGFRHTTIRVLPPSRPRQPDASTHTCHHAAYPERHTTFLRSTAGARRTQYESLAAAAQTGPALRRNSTKPGVLTRLCQIATAFDGEANHGSNSDGPAGRNVNLHVLRGCHAECSDAARRTEREQWQSLTPRWRVWTLESEIVEKRRLSEYRTGCQLLAVSP